MLILTVTAILVVLVLGYLQIRAAMMAEVQLPPDWQYWTPEMQNSFMQVQHGQVIAITDQITQMGSPPSVAVYTPIWLPLFALIFSTFIGMLSGLYPALRAATMIPVLALKYE